MPPGPAADRSHKGGGVNTLPLSSSSKSRSHQVPRRLSPEVQHRLEGLPTRFILEQQLQELSLHKNINSLAPRPSPSTSIQSLSLPRLIPLHPRGWGDGASPRTSVLKSRYENAAS